MRGGMLKLLRTFIFSALSLLPAAVADTLSTWELQGIVTIHFSEPVVPQSIVDNQFEPAATPADKGLELFSITGDTTHPPRVLWVDQDCLRIEPSPGTSVQTEYTLKFNSGARYQSGRPLQQSEYRFRAPASPLVHEDLRSHANGAALVFARHQNTREARSLNPKSPVTYAFARLKMDERGDFFESGETAEAVVEQAQVRHGNSYNMLRSLAALGAKWEKLEQNTPLPGYVVIRPARQLPQGSIWRLTAKPAPGSGIAESNLGPIYVNRYLTACLEQQDSEAEGGNILELRFNAQVDKQKLQQAFREMSLTLDGVETTLSEDGCTRTAVVNGRELKVRYLGELESDSFSITPDVLQKLGDDTEELGGVRVSYSHPTASRGMKLSIESPVPVLAECTLKQGLQAVLGLPLEHDFTCRCSVTPMAPAVGEGALTRLPLQGKHTLELPVVNGSRAQVRLRHWEADAAAAALPHICRHLEQQKRRGDLGELLYERAVVQARIKAGLAEEKEMPTLPEGYERAREVYRDRIFLQPAGGKVLGEQNLPLPAGENLLVNPGRISVDLDALCGGQPKPGMYLIEVDFHPSEPVAAAARSMGLNPAELVLRRDVLVSVSDLSVSRLRDMDSAALLVLQQSDGSVMHAGSATLVTDEGEQTHAPVQDGVVRLRNRAAGHVLVRRGDDYCVARLDDSRNPFALEENEKTKQEGPELRAMLWTDRPVYRPGEKVYVRGFLRAVDGQNRITHSQHRELQLQFLSPAGEKLFTRVFNVDEYGAFSQELTLPQGQEDVCGSYSVVVGTTRPRTLARAAVQCEVFRRDSFVVETEDMTEAVAPKELVLRVKAADLNGTPVNRGRVELKVHSERPLEGARVEKQGSWAAYVLETELQLAEDGTAEFRKPLDGTVTTNFSVQYEGSVVNEREEHRTFNECGLYSAAEVTPDLDVSESCLKLRCSNCGKALHYGLSVRVQLQSRREQVQQLPNGFALVGKHEETLWSEWVNVPADCTGGVQLPLAEVISRNGVPEDSHFTVQIMGRDYQGRVFERLFRYYPLTNRPAREVWLTSSDKPGELVLNAQEDGDMLLVVRHGAAMRATVLAVQKGTSVFTAPLLEHETGKVMLNAAMIRRNPETGLLELTGETILDMWLPPTQNKLKIQLDLPQTALPGSTQTLSGRVTLPDGSPASAAVTLYAVDDGMLMGNSAPDVVTSLSRWGAYYPFVFHDGMPWHAANRLPLSPLPGVWQGEARMADGSWKHQPWWMQEYIGAAGGDLQDADFQVDASGVKPVQLTSRASGGTYYRVAHDSYRAKALAEVDDFWKEAPMVTAGASPRVRRDFAPLAVWRSALKTDAEGRFSTTCKLPDTLTTYRVFAVAADKSGSRFGSQEGNMLVNQPVMLSAGTPLFMSVGDKLQLPVTVTNNTTAEGSWQVQLEGSSAPQQTMIPAGGSATLMFEVAARQPGTHTCRWVVTGERGQDAAEGSFEVRHPAPLLKGAHHLVLEPGQGRLEPQKLLAQELAAAPGCELELLVSANPLLHLQGAVDFLLHQPEWPFLERQASALLPWLLYDRLAPLCPRMAQTPAEQVERTIARTVENLLKYQNADGGLPFSAAVGESNPWVSAHVAMVLRMAEERGHTLPWARWYKLQDYLARADLSATHPLTRYEAARALQNREAQRDALKAALAATEPDCWCSSSVRHDIEFLEYLRTNNDGRHEAFLRWIRTRAADDRHHSSWRSAWSLYALMTYVGNSPGAQVEAILRLPHGLALLDRGVRHVSKFNLGDACDSLRGTVYAVLRAKARPQQTDYPGVTEKGLQMTRMYEKQGEDGIWREATEFAVGDVVRVSLTCAKAGEQELHHLVLEDYLPASMEAINPNVPSQAAGLEPLNWSDWFTHREYLADRVRGFCTRWPGRDVVNMRYYARVKRAGTATAPPAQAQLFYEPQTYGLSPSARLETIAE